MPPVLTITLNPALDVSTAVDRLEPRAKLRCDPPRYDPGGGGINVSRAIRELGGDSLAFVVLGGFAGAHVRRLLDAAGVACETWPSEGETRVTFHVTARDEGEQYRFVLPGPEHAPGEAEALLARLAARVGEGGHRFVVASGSLPPGLPADFYARLARAVRPSGARLILDTSGPALQAALAETPFLVKLDRFEAASLMSGRMPDDCSAEALATGLRDGGAAETVIVTLGAGGAVVAMPGETLRLVPPEVEVVSPVGAGDSFVAALSLGLSRGQTIADASRFGVAAAASAVTTEATALCRRAQTEALFERVVAR